MANEKTSTLTLNKLHHKITVGMLLYLWKVHTQGLDAGQSPSRGVLAEAGEGTRLGEMVHCCLLCPLLLASRLGTLRVVLLLPDPCPGSPVVHVCTTLLLSRLLRNLGIYREITLPKTDSVQM